ncbi:hypothetical protein Tco_0511548 [Tanacetum coccineum]
MDRQRSSASSSATSGSSKNQLTEFFQEQIQLDREAKKESLDPELAARLAVVELQKRNEDLKILTFDTTGMNPEDAARIEALKKKARATFKGPSDTKENRIMDLKLEYQTFRAKPSKSLSRTYTRYKILLNELADDGVNFSKHEINVGFVNSLPEKWLTFSQGLRNANHTQTLNLVDINERPIRRIHQGRYGVSVPALTKDHKEKKINMPYPEEVNTPRNLVPESQVINESLKPTKGSTNLESSKDYEAESLTPLPPLKHLQGALPSLEVMQLTFQPYSPKERPGLVPTGRVVVPTGRHIVPAGKVIIIVSTGRLSLVPTGRVLSPDRWINSSQWEIRDIASWVEWSWCGWTRVRRKGNSAGGFGGMWERMNSDLFTGCRLGDLARTVPERVICYYRDGPCSFQIWPLQFGLGLHR